MTDLSAVAREILRLEEEATPGEWAATPLEDAAPVQEIRRVGSQSVVAYTEGCYRLPQESANANLIAYARNNVAALARAYLEAVAALRKERP